MGKFSKIAVAATLSLAVIGTPALAREQRGEVAVSKVSYTDLDLSTAGGMNTLKSRLNLAAREVCGMNIKVSGSTLPTREARACYVKTRAGFAPQMAYLAGRQTRRG